MRHKRLLMVADTQNIETLGSCVRRKGKSPLSNLFIIIGTDKNTTYCF